MGKRDKNKRLEIEQDKSAEAHYQGSLKRVAMAPSSANYLSCAEWACKAALAAHAAHDPCTATAYARAAQGHAQCAMAMCETEFRIWAVLHAVAEKVKESLGGKVLDRRNGRASAYWNAYDAAQRAQSVTESSGANARSAQLWAQTCAKYL